MFFEDVLLQILLLQVAGKWVFAVSALSPDKSQTCGFRVPDTNAQHFEKPGFRFQVAKTIRVTMEGDSNQPLLYVACSNSRWTCKSPTSWSTPREIKV